jgi:NRPS condensation-like uncharacterized protein
MNDHCSEIPNVPLSDSYELSYAQQWIGSAHQYPDEQPKGNASFVLQIGGPLDPEALENAVQTVVSRHEALRTTFITVNGALRQQVIPAELFNAQINHIDISNYESKEELSSEIIQEEHAFPFDILRDHLLRVTLVRLSQKQFIFMLCMHPIISDYGSTAIIAGELFTLYNAYRGKAGNRPAPLRIQYKDFAAWQNTWLQGERLVRLENYWLDRFMDKPTPSRFPTDFPGNSPMFPNGNLVRFEIGNELTAALNRTAALNDTDLLAVLMAGIVVLLNRYTGETDIILGMPVNIRNHQELDEQVGPYNNILPVRVQLKAGNDSFCDILARVKRTLQDARAHDQYPYSRLVEKLGLVNNKSRFLLINILVQVQQALVIPEIPGLTVKDCSPEHFTNNVDFTFNFRQTENNIKAGIEYNAGMFKNTTVNQVIRNLLHIIRLTTATNELTINQIKLLEIIPVP